MDLWIFAVNNKFPELAAYSLTNPLVKRDIVTVLKNQEKGLRWFLEEMRIPLMTMQKVVAAVACSSTWERERTML